MAYGVSLYRAVKRFTVRDLLVLCNYAITSSMIINHEKILDWDVTIYQTRSTLGKATFQNVKNILLFKLKEIICGWPVDAC